MTHVTVDPARPPEGLRTPDWFYWPGEIHIYAGPWPAEWSAWFYDQDGRHVIVRRSMESMVAAAEGDDSEICGARFPAARYVCALPPGHETRHLPSSETLVEQGFRVTHIASTTQPMRL